MKTFFSLCAVTLCVLTMACAQETSAPADTAAASAAIDPAKKDLILKFIDVFGTKAAMTQNLEDMIASMPQDGEDTKKLKEGIKVDEIIERLVPVYDKQFSSQELQAYIDFYSSENGKKLVRSIPVIMEESIDVSSKYFEEKFPDMQQEAPAPELPSGQ